MYIASAVEENIKRSKFFREGLYGVRTANIEQTRSYRGVFSGECIERTLIDVRSPHSRAFGCEAQRGSPANSLPCSGDQRSFVRQSSLCRHG